MKSVGLITEYNPFHNGHLYHAQQSKLQSDAEISIAIMSGNSSCVASQQFIINS